MRGERAGGPYTVFKAQAHGLCVEQRMSTEAHTVALLLARHATISPRALGAFCLTTRAGRAVMEEAGRIWAARGVAEGGRRERTTWRALGESGRRLLTRTEVRRAYRLTDDVLRALDGYVVHHARHRCDTTLFDARDAEAAARAVHAVPAHQTLAAFFEERAARPSAARLARDAQLAKALDGLQAPVRALAAAHPPVRAFLETGRGGVRAVKANLLAPLQRVAAAADGAEVRAWLDAEPARWWDAVHAWRPAEQPLAQWVRRREEWDGLVRERLGAGATAYLADDLCRDRRAFLATGLWAPGPAVQRYATLYAALAARGLQLRDDSALCRAHVFGGAAAEAAETAEGAVAELVQTMDDMHYLYTRTDYARRLQRACDAAYRALRDDGVHDPGELREAMREERQQLSRRLKTGMLRARAAAAATDATDAL